jgi:hypothetical protein
VLFVLLRVTGVGLALGAFVAITLVILLRLANIAVPSWEAERQVSADLYGFLRNGSAGTEDPLQQCHALCIGPLLPAHTGFDAQDDPGRIQMEHLDEHHLGAICFRQRSYAAGQCLSLQYW